MRAGRTDVANVAGGMDAWERAGLPVRRGRPTPGEGDLPRLSVAGLTSRLAGAARMRRRRPRIARGLRLVGEAPADERAG